MEKGIVHTRTVSTLLIVICIIVSAGLSGYFLDLYKTSSGAENIGPTADAGDTILYGYPAVPLKFNGSLSYDPDGSIVSYIWDFDDGFTGIGLTPVHSYELVGNYTVSLTVTDDDRATNTTFIHVIIRENDGGTGLYTKVTVKDILDNGDDYIGMMLLLSEVTVSDAGSYSSGYGSDPTGWVKFEVSDSTTTGSLDIYCEGGATRPLDLSNGDIINVTGILELYNSAWEIVVRKDTTDKVELAGSGGGGGTLYTEVTISQMLASLSTYNNTNICILGALVVDYYPGSTWIKVTIKDNTSSTNVVVFGFDGADIATVSAGDYVDVYGNLQWYQPSSGDGYPEIMIREGTDDRVELASGGGGGTGDYTVATVNQLLTSTSTYNGTNVCVLGALVLDYYVGSSWIKVTITDNSTSGSIVVFGFDGANFETASAGDYVDVYGHLEWYQPTTGAGYLEIAIREDTDDRVVVSAGGGGGGTVYTLATVNQLLTSTATYNNTNVHVQGALVVEFYAGSTWTKVTITDNSTSSSIIAFGFDGANITTSSAGDYVDVYGHLEWYQPTTGTGYPEIMIREDTDDRISISSGGGGGGGGTGNYTLATVNQLLTSTSTYNGTDVCVLNALVVEYYAGSTWTKVTIKDSSSSSSMVAFGFDGADIATVSAGDYVDVFGHLEWYQPTTGSGYLEIAIREDTDDRVVLNATGGGGGGTGAYTLATVNQLLTSTSTYNNTDVCVLNALVIDFYVGSTWKKVTITDSSTSSNIVAFGFTGADIETASAGDYVDVFGHLEWYQPTSGDGYLEILINADTDDRIVVNSTGGGGGGLGDYTAYTINTLLANSAAHENELVAVLNAEILDYYAPSFIKLTVTDTSTSSELIVFCDSDADVDSVSIGDFVDIFGTFVYYTSGSYWEIMVESGGDDRVTLNTSGGGGGGGDEYTVYTVDELLTNSETHEDELVAVLWAEVTSATTPSYKISIIDNSTGTELVVYCSYDAVYDNVVVGDYVNVYGQFVWYDGATSDYWEINVRADSSDTIELATGGGGGGGGEGSGTKADPYNVASCIDLQNDDPYVVAWVSGYIVGAVKTGLTSVDASSDIDYVAPFDSATNVVIADSPSETNIANFAIVNLPTSTALRTNVNLLDNPDNRGKLLNVTGTFRSYFGIAGVRDCPGTTNDYVLSGTGGGGGAEYTTYTLNELLTNSAAHAEELVAIMGATVDTLTQAYQFTITDSSTSGNVVVYCAMGSTYDSVSVGDDVNVYGLFTYYSTGGYYEIKIQADTEDRVELVSGGGGEEGDYTLVTISQLLASPATYEDQEIYVLSAVVTNSNSYWKGFASDPSSWVSFYVKDNSTSSTITVYCEGDADRPLSLTNGTWIDVSGVLFDYSGTWEIKVRADSSDNVSLASSGTEPPLPEPGYTEVTVDDLLTDPETYMDRNVSISGAIVSDAFTYNLGTVYPFNWVVFFITDESTSSSIKVYCEPFATRPDKLSNWNEVNVKGVLGEQYGMLEIVVRNNDDDIVQRMSNGYSVYSVKQLLENDFEGQEVCVLGAVVTNAYSYNGGYGDEPGDLVMFYISDATTTSSLLVTCQPFADRPLTLSDDDFVNVYAILDIHYSTKELVVRADTNDTVTISGSSGKVVYYLTDHGAETGVFNSFADAVNAAGFAYIEGPLAAANLSQVKMLIIRNPNTAFTAGELATINAYVNGGGSLLLLCKSDFDEAGRPENLNPILADLGVEGRFNDDRFRDMLNCYDMWSYSNYDETIPYFNYYSASNHSHYDAGCYALDSTGITSDVLWVRGLSVCSLYNTSDDITVIRGSSWGYNEDNDPGANEAYYHSYPVMTGAYPPILAANGSIGLGKVLYGGLASTFSDNNAAGWTNSNLTELVIGMLGWAAEATGSQSPPTENSEEAVVPLTVTVPDTLNVVGARTMTSAIPPGRNEY